MTIAQFMATIRFNSVSIVRCQDYYMETNNEIKPAHDTCWQESL